MVRVVAQHPLQEREFTNQQGNTERFASMGFVLRRGSDMIYAEMVQETARKQGPVDRNTLFFADVQFQTRSWKDQNQKERFENRVILTKLTVL